jgi:hypothetical protein
MPGNYPGGGFSILSGLTGVQIFPRKIRHGPAIRKYSGMHRDPRFSENFPISFRSRAGFFRSFRMVIAHNSRDLPGSTKIRYMKNPVHIQKRNDLSLKPAHQPNSWQDRNYKKLLPGGPVTHPLARKRTSGSFQKGAYP